MVNNITIKKVVLKYAWKWKIDEDVCMICQENFTSICQKCSHPTDCVPCIGVCSHIFHFHCLNEWLKSKVICPVCRGNWKYKKIFKPFIVKGIKENIYDKPLC